MNDVSSESSAGAAPLVVTVFNPLTNQGRTLATISEDQVAWLEACLALLSSAPRSSGARRSSATLLAPSTARPGPKGKKVIVVDVSDENDTPYGIGDEFENAVAASKSLDLPTYTVGLALKGAAPAKLRGLTLRYSDELTELERADINEKIRD